MNAGGMMPSHPVIQKCYNQEFKNTVRDQVGWGIFYINIPEIFFEPRWLASSVCYMDIEMTTESRLAVGSQNLQTM